MSLDDWKELPRRRLESRELGSDPVSERIAYALDNGLSVEILYASTDNLTRRTVWPKHIDRVKTDRYGTTYLRAYCETRGEDRTFRLDRIRAHSTQAEHPFRSSRTPRSEATRLLF